MAGARGTPARRKGVLITKKDKRRFWTKVQKGKGKDACWWWTGAIGQNGQTHFSYKNRTIRANQFSWMLHNGEIPDKKELHIKCGNYCCVNPDHLSIGIPKERTKKSRMGVCSVCGEEELIKYIYDDGCRGPPPLPIAASASSYRDPRWGLRPLKCLSE